ncbi:MAG: PAS domain S-box protein [Deltaproteobacteria bacterium]|nr:PAS domain S-box protein [Deltaproteobacteria bacterium]
MFRDITERRRAEEALRETRHLVDRILESTPNLIYIYDLAEHRNMYANREVTEFLGYTPQQVQAMGSALFGNILHPDDTATVAEHHARMASAAESEVQTVEYRMRHHRGEWRWLRSRDVPFSRDEKRAARRILGFAEDVTEHKHADEALRAAHRKFESLIKASPVGIATLDPGRKLTLWNPALEQMFGWTAGEVLGRTLPYIPPEESEEHAGILTRVMSGEPFDGIALRTARKDGSHIDVSMSTAAYLDDDGNIMGVLGVVQDITERTLAELELRETKELFTSFMRHSPIYSFIKEVTPTESRVLHASENYEQMIGIKGSDMVGKTMAQLFPAEFAAKMTADDWAVVSKGEILTTDEDLDDRNYTTVKAPITLGDKTLLVGHTIDITARKQAEAKLAETARRLELATSSGGLGVWDWDIKNNRMAWDDRMFELYGIRKDTFPARIDAWLNGLHPEDKERAVAECQAALDGKKEFDTTFRVVHPEGTVKYLKANGLVIRDQDCVAVRMLGLNKDITDSRLYEEERERLQEQLLHSQKLESVGRLAGGVAHDFNNMLGVILGHADLALKTLEPTHRLYADLEAIRKAAERSADLTRQLLMFARRQTVAPKVLDLNDTMAGALKMLRPLIGEEIQLNWRPEADVWPVNVDPSQIDQILANLCVNARDAIAGVGKITIETGNVTLDGDYCVRHAGFVPGEYVRLVVSDDGCGMDKETLTHVFEPFFTTKGVGEGTGLGLATVYGIVKQNNGFINVYSEVGQGTTLVIYLPRHVGKTAQTQTDGGAKPRLRGQETILLVEDEPAILNVTTEMLETLGYIVVAAGTPGEALSLARERAGEIHLLMTDVVMPEMNGRDLAKNLLSLYPDLRRLFMSGYTANVIAHHGVLDEGVHFIQKPFSLTALAAKVREALEE